MQKAWKAAKIKESVTKKMQSFKWCNQEQVLNDNSPSQSGLITAKIVYVKWNGCGSQLKQL